MSRFNFTRLERAFYKIDRTEMWKRQKERCAYCHKKIPHDKITFDHVIPISKLRYHSISNCVVACEQCNQAKAAQVDWKPVVPELEEWEQILEDGLDRLTLLIRKFQYTTDTNPMGSYNRWLKYWTKRGRWE